MLFYNCIVHTGLAGVRGHVGLLSGGYSSCIELSDAAPGDGAVLWGVAGWLWGYKPPLTSFLDLPGVQVGSSPDAT